MYLEHFGLGANPFSLSPKLDFLYKSETYEESMAHLVYGLDNHEAIVLITGPVGIGKTMVLQSFLTNLGPRFEFALIANTRITTNELLQLLLEDLGVEVSADADKSDLLILFKDYLHEASREGKMVLIVVDEAQNLAPEVLMEIQMLTNLGQGETQPVQIILVGQPELDETVNRPDLAQIRQRIRVNYKLSPLTRPETEEYIIHRLAVAGCSRNLFTNDAVDRIFRGSRGVPRLVNTLAGEALLSAFVAGHEMVEPGDIEEDQDLGFEAEAAFEAEQDSAAQETPQSATPASPPAPEPEPEPSPGMQTSQPKSQQPIGLPPLMELPESETARRNSLKGAGGIVWAWGIGALVVAILGALYFMGTLDGLVTAISPNSNQVTTLIPDPETEATVTPSQVETPAEIPESTPVEGEAPVQVAAPAMEDGFYLHIYSFRNPDRAESFVREWDHPQYDITSRTKEIQGVAWRRIYIGPFAARDKAFLEALRLQKDGVIDYYEVTTLPSDQGF
jgi:general secretion pathway protein A